MEPALWLNVLHYHLQYWHSVGTPIQELHTQLSVNVYENSASMWETQTELDPGLDLAQS